MRQQKVMTFEESWERLFDVFERYYCQHEETDRQRVVRMHEFLSSSSSLGEEFVAIGRITRRTIAQACGTTA